MKRIDYAKLRQMPTLPDTDLVDDFGLVAVVAGRPNPYVADQPTERQQMVAAGQMDMMEGAKAK